MKQAYPMSICGKTHKTVSILLMLNMIVFIVFSILLVSPISALALETVKCTARPNSDGTGEVLAATNTRITWEAQAAETEQLSSISLTMPEGTDFSIDDARLTVLSGDDLMDRNVVDAEFSQDGETFIATFDPLDAGSYIRIEIYNVFFPSEGGEMQIVGEYKLANGETLEIPSIPAITVSAVSLPEQISNWLDDQEWVQVWNSNKFLHMFFDPTILVTSFPVVFQGFLMAVAIVAVSFPLAIPFGFVLSLMRISKISIFRGIAAVYVNVVRGTPMFLQIYIAFFGLPLAGVQIPSFPLGVIVLAMNSGAYLCEIFRAGIQSISKGQFEAARSLGMNGAQTMISVIIPQTVRRVIPTMTSEFILLYKDTSLLAAVGVMEVVMYAKTIVASTGSITPYIVAACFYLVITLPLAKLVGILESRLATGESAAGFSSKSKKRRHRKNKDQSFKEDQR